MDQALRYLAELFDGAQQSLFEGAVQPLMFRLGWGNLDTTKDTDEYSRGCAYFCGPRLSRVTGRNNRFVCLVSSLQHVFERLLCDGAASVVRYLWELL